MKREQIRIFHGCVQRQGQILLLSCGIGNPCFTTDTCVALRAIELECDAVLMAKNIDGVYTADPHVDPSATLISDISYGEAAERGLKVMDATAFILLRDNHVPQVRVFGLEPPTNILRVLEEEYQQEFGRNLTLNRLSEAILSPTCPDKGKHVYYDGNLPASSYVENDIRQLVRLRNITWEEKV